MPHEMPYRQRMETPAETPKSKSDRPALNSSVPPASGEVLKRNVHAVVQPVRQKISELFGKVRSGKKKG